jgi:hypothetical protein
MSRGKRRSKGKKVVRVVKKKPPVKDAINPVDLDSVPPAMRPIVQGLKDAMEKRIRYAEMKSLHQNQKITKMIDEIKANQIVLQTLLHEAQIINREKFSEEYQRYINEVVGVVKSGRMEGAIYIDTFNIGVAPRENSLKDLKCIGNNPIIVNRS